MSYTIIGGDGKEYGPISTDDIRQWISEGRLNAQSLAKSESDAEFRPLEKFPEFAYIWAARPPGITASPVSSAVSEEDYELDIGGCISNGWELVKKHFGILFACVLVMFGMQIALSGLLNTTLIGNLAKTFHTPADSIGLGFLLAALNSLVLGPLLGGIYLIYLKTIRGEPTAVSEIFAGFKMGYSQLFLGQLLIGLISSLCLAPFNYVFAEKINPLMLKLQGVQGQPPAPADVGNLMGQMLAAFTGSLPVFIICMIPLTYLVVSLQFTLALIADKHLDVGAAMKTSWQRVNRHWWQVFGLSVLAGLLILAGGLVCCIGVLVTFPLYLAATLFGYETIFNAKKE